MGDIKRDGPPPDVTTDAGAPGASAATATAPDEAVDPPEPGSARPSSSRPAAGLPGAPFAAPGADLLAPPARPGPRATTAERPAVASLGTLLWVVVLAAAAWVAAAATRALPDWDQGRWWMLTIGLDGVAVVLAVVAVVLGVSALGEVVRHRPNLRGGARAVVALVLAGVLVCVAGVGAVDDWDDLDVPAAWDRLDVGSGGGPSLKDLADSARDASTAPAGSIRTAGRVGGCYGGTVDEPGDEVACSEPHTLEILDQIVVDAAAGDDVRDRRDAGREQCDAIGEARLEAEVTGVEVVALVPDEISWVAGDRNGVCLAASEEPVTGSVGG